MTANRVIRIQYEILRDQTRRLKKNRGGEECGSRNGGGEPNESKQTKHRLHIRP